jgi:DNA-binding transcriptional ArsR family regulator
MTNVASLAGIAALIGDPARAVILVTLMDGRALTAGELAKAAGVTPSTASGHLSRMLEAGLLALERQGRHRYYRIANASVAGLVETMMSLSGELNDAASRSKKVSTGPRDRALRRARLCYDHLAGEVAVSIADRMIARGQLDWGQDGGIVTEQGMELLAALGVDLCSDSSASSRRTPFCRPCLDWSERRPHVAGSVGRALYDSFVRHGWVRQSGVSRAVLITPLGVLALNRHFDLAPS